MKTALRQKVIVQPGGVIHVHAPELKSGSSAEVIVLVESSMENSLAKLIGSAKGGFASPAEADAFIRRERDAWTS